MPFRSRLPMFVVAAALLGLIALLATLQYRWLGQISAAERERMKANLASRTAAFAQDFDREITRAYLTFQADPGREGTGDNLVVRVGERYDRWHATSAHPRLIKDVFVVGAGAGALQRYNPAAHVLEPAQWSAPLEPIRAALAQTQPSPLPGTVVLRGVPVVWERVPALLVPGPMTFFSRPDAMADRGIRHTLLVLDREYLAGEMLPALARQHFRGGAEAIEYQIAVVSGSAETPVFTTSTALTGQGDASADLFQVRVQEFGAMVAEVRRFTTMSAQIREKNGASGRFIVRESAPMSIMLQHSGELPNEETRKKIEASLTATMARPGSLAGGWKLVVKHPSGSLETAVTTARRRNLLVSSGILAVLGVSIGFLVVSTRRAQDLARQQMEFVAAVSHELRTPLAVIRSAAENLADGVISEDRQVRQYGELVRGEGRRLSEMVEQILELAGIHSGQRGFALRPVAVLPLLHDVARSSATLVEDAGLTVEFDVPDGLPPVLGDEQALRRLFQNLFGNAVKYGASGGWIGVRARASGRDVQVTIADRGIGIAPAEQAHIFEPFYRAPGVIEAQIQGAGLGLSLVERIVDAHAGRITVRSAPGEGSEFTVHLPSASEEAVARQPTSDPAHDVP